MVCGFTDVQDVDRIDDLCGEIDRGKSLFSRFICLQSSQARGKKTRWQVIGYSSLDWGGCSSTHAEHECVSGCYRGTLWQFNKKTTKFTVEAGSADKEWTDRIEYYFYSNGKTALISETLVTKTRKHSSENSIGPYRLEKKVYYDKSGREIRVIERAEDIGAGKVIPPRFLPGSKIIEYRKAGEIAVRE